MAFCVPSSCRETGGGVGVSSFVSAGKQAALRHWLPVRRLVLPVRGVVRGVEGAFSRLRVVGVSVRYAACRGYTAGGEGHWRRHDGVDVVAFRLPVVDCLLRAPFRLLVARLIRLAWTR